MKNTIKRIAHKTIWLTSTAIFCAGSSLALAGSTADGLVMSVVEDRAYGELVQKGAYTKAISRINDVDSRFPYPAHTNLCVAHTLMGDYVDAAPHCDEAVELAQKAAEKGKRRDRDYPAELAMAYSNRGVQRARSGDLAGAEADFQAAMNTDSGLSIMEWNLVKFGQIQADNLASR